MFWVFPHLFLTLVDMPKGEKNQRGMCMHLGVVTLLVSSHLAGKKYSKCQHYNFVESLCVGAGRNGLFVKETKKSYGT